jgi:hypothetical protein
MNVKGSLIVDGVVVARDVLIKRGSHGDILYKHRQKWKKLHIGTVGQVLVVDANGFPSWGPMGPPAFNDYFMQTFGGTDQTGALMGEPQPDIVAGLTVILMHDGYYYTSPS